MVGNIKIFASASILLLVVSLSVGLYVQHTRLRAAHAELESARQQLVIVEASNAAYVKALAATESEMRRRDAAIVARDAGVQTINTRRETQRQVIVQAVKNDEQTRDWHTTALPAAAIGVLSE